MKLNVTNDDTRFIDGCININVKDYDEKVFEEIPQSSCELVIISQCMGELPYHQCHEFLTMCANRVRAGGSICISLMDVEAIFISYLNGSTDSRELSQILETKITVLRFHEVKQVLLRSGIGLKKVERKNNLLLLNGIKK